MASERSILTTTSGRRGIPIVARPRAAIVSLLVAAALIAGCASAGPGPSGSPGAGTSTGSGPASGPAAALAGALAAIGGAFFTSFPAPGVNNATGLLALTAIPAAVLGGLDSTAGAVVGGLTIGVATTLASGYQDQIAFLGRGLSEVVPYIVLLVVLLWRPSGVFGTKEVARV